MCINSIMMILCPSKTAGIKTESESQCAIKNKKGLFFSGLKVASFADVFEIMVENKSGRKRLTGDNRIEN